MKYRSFALTLLVLAPVALEAQITTFVPPTRKEDSVRAATVAEQRTHVDSVTRASLTNMTAWVDSAAGVAMPGTPVADTVVRTTTTNTTRSVTTFSEGSVAPDTASVLPLLALLGLAALSLGTVMLAGRHRA